MILRPPAIPEFLVPYKADHSGTPVPLSGDRRCMGKSGRSGLGSIFKKSHTTPMERPFWTLSGMIGVVWENPKKPQKRAKNGLRSPKMGFLGPKPGSGPFSGNSGSRGGLRGGNLGISLPEAVCGAESQLFR